MKPIALTSLTNKNNQNNNKNSILSKGVLKQKTSYNNKSINNGGNISNKNNNN